VKINASENVMDRGTSVKQVLSAKGIKLNLPFIYGVQEQVLDGSLYRLNRQNNWEKDSIGNEEQFLYKMCRIRKMNHLGSGSRVQGIKNDKIPEVSLIKAWNSRLKCPSVILRKLYGWLMNFCGNFHHCVVTEAATISVLCPCEQDWVVWSV
jgi:hypothetical protein